MMIEKPLSRISFSMVAQEALIVYIHSLKTIHPLTNKVQTAHDVLHAGLAYKKPDWVSLEAVAHNYKFHCRVSSEMQTGCNHACRAKSLG